METVKNINEQDDSGNISIEDLKKVACLQHLSDEDLKNAVDVIVKFTEIAYEVFRLNGQDTRMVPLIKIGTNNANVP